VLVRELGPEDAVPMLAAAALAANKSAFKPLLLLTLWLLPLSTLFFLFLGALLMISVSEGRRKLAAEEDGLKKNDKLKFQFILKINNNNN